MGMRETEEAEVMSWNIGSKLERLFALKLLDTVIDVLEPLASRAKVDHSRQPKPKRSKARQESSDGATPHETCASYLSASFSSHS